MDSGVDRKPIFAVGIAAATVVAFVAILILTKMFDHSVDASTLTLLVIGGAVALVAVIALVATIYNVLGLTDPSQAMALPEGSVRAVVALLLLVLFVMLAVFFYQGLQSAGATTSLSNQTEAQLIDFVAKNPGAANMSIKAVAGSAPAAALYNISYGGGDANASDFAKTLMAALETLLTTVIGFYFGAKTATSSAAATAQQIATGNAPPPSLASIDPATSASPPNGPPTLTLKINGANLNPMVNAHIERAGAGSVPLTNVASNPTQVVGQLAITPALAGPAWDVVVADAAGNTQRSRAALTIT